jgi:hypothetical protein
MKRLFPVVAFLLLAVVLTSCAPGANSQLDTPNAQGAIAGFWLGLWHGFIAPFAFVFSLFSKTVEIYEVHNNGGWYDFGYLIGISAIFGGGGAGGAASRRWR